MIVGNIPERNSPSVTHGVGQPHGNDTLTVGSSLSLAH